MQSPILIYQPSSGVAPLAPGAGTSPGNMYYWPDIDDLTGGDFATDLDGQDISILPIDALIIVITGGTDESHWLRVAYTSVILPVTDLDAGVIVPINFDQVLRPYVLHKMSLGVGGAAPATGATRVTSSGDVRVTTTGDFRII